MAGGRACTQFEPSIRNDALELVLLRRFTLLGGHPLTGGSFEPHRRAENFGAN